MVKTFLFKRRPLKMECSRAMQMMNVQLANGVARRVSPGDWMVFSDDGFIVDVLSHAEFIVQFAPASKAGKQYMDNQEVVHVEPDQGSIPFDTRTASELSASADYHGDGDSVPVTGDNMEIGEQ